MRAFALMLMLSLPVRAQDAQLVPEGCLLPAAKCIKVAEELAQCRKPKPPPEPAPFPWLAVGLALLGGFAVGYTVASQH